MQIKFHFLVSPGAFTAELAGWDSQPAEAGTSVMSFGGSRDIGYLPTSRFDQASALAGLDHRFDIDSDGQRVSIYERTGLPATFTAVWWLSGGVLCTFVDENAASAKAMEAVATSIKLVADEGAIPRLVLGPPLQRSNLRDIAHRDFVAFERPDEDLRLMLFEEPSPRRRKSSFVVDDRAEAWETTGTGVRVSVLGPKSRQRELEQLAGQVAQSIGNG